MLGACSDEVPAIDKNEAYTREFIKKYGVPDAGSDWNAAARAEATVQGTMPAGAAYVQVFYGRPHVARRHARRRVSRSQEHLQI